MTAAVIKLIVMVVRNRDAALKTGPCVIQVFTREKNREFRVFRVYITDFRLLSRIPGVTRP